jgi:TPR repeat protein
MELKMKKKSILTTIILLLLITIFLLVFFCNDIHIFNKSLDVDAYANKNSIEQEAEKGDPIAQSNLGFLYENKKQYTQAAYWYNKSAMQGYGPAQYNIGVAYRYGRGVSQNLQKASEWYQKSANQGITQAQVNLGMLYLLGLGVSVDYVIARQWFMKASENGNSIAIFNVGQLYFYGLGVPKDYLQAEIWLKKAVDLGSMRAKNSLALFYGKGLGNIPLDINEAMKLLKSSACQGYTVAQENLGGIYIEGGKGFPQDYQQSYAWYAVAVENGSHKAKEMQERVVKKLTDEELKQAKFLAETYIKKYPAPLDENDTNKSNTECTYP